MSSYEGTSTVDGQGNDPGLQLAPADNEPPDFALLKKAFDECVADLQPFFDQTEDNANTRFARWSGQSADGRKHKREQDKTDPTPWDGASDLQVFLVDQAIKAKVAMLSMGFRRAGISASPVEGNDFKRAKIVANFMRWLVHTQIPEMAREVKLLANIIQEQGVAAIGCFWENNQDKILVTVSVEQLQRQFPQLNIPELIFAEEAEDTLVAIIEELYDCGKAKAKAVLVSLRKTETATVPSLGRMKSRPVVRAFNLNRNLFIPACTTDMETAPRMFRLEYYTAEQLRSLVNTSEWDAGWVEGAIETCRGKLISISQNEYNQPLTRSAVSQGDRLTDLIGVVYAYERLSDEDGNSGLYQTIFNPLMGPDEKQDGYAKHGLLGYAHGQYPFVIFRREILSRKLHDARGVPEPGKPIQQQIKVHKDSLVDAASIAICPPLMYPQGRPPTRWGANARVAERRPGEYHYADRPAYDPSTQKSEESLRADFNQYNGFVSRESDPTFSSLLNQDEVDEFLDNWSKIFLQIWKLFKQFGKETTFFRVVGLRQAEPVEFHKGDSDEEFDFMLRFSVDSMDPENTFKKLEQIAKIVATADRDGVINYTEWMTTMIEAIDPVIAERIIDPKEVGQARVVADMQDMMAKVYAGVDQDIKLGTPPDLGLQVIQSYVAGDPVVQQRMQNQQDPFGARIQKLAKQLEFQKTQRDNARIGQLGA